MIILQIQLIIHVDRSGSKFNSSSSMFIMVNWHLSVELADNIIQMVKTLSFDTNFVRPGICRAYDNGEKLGKFEMFQVGIFTLLQGAVPFLVWSFGVFQVGLCQTYVIASVVAWQKRPEAWSCNLHC